jgi:hypothetical protein
LRETEKQAKERRATTGVVADVVPGQTLAAHRQHLAAHRVRGRVQP